MPIVSRRGFLAGAFTCAGVLRAQQNNQQAQTFLAGLAAGAPRPGRTQGGPPPRPVSRGPEARIENFWRACDDCSRLGVHYVEFNNTHRGIMEAYESRIGEYRDEMAKRGLTLLEFALYGIAPILIKWSATGIAARIAIGRLSFACTHGVE